jgi:hypothetical protein
LDDDVGGFVFFFAAGMMVNSGGVKRTNERMNERVRLFCSSLLKRRGILSLSIKKSRAK